MHGPIINDTNSQRLGVQRPGKPGQTTEQVWTIIRRYRARMLPDAVPGTERWHEAMRDGVVYLGWSVQARVKP